MINRKTVLGAFALLAIPAIALAATSDVITGRQANMKKVGGAFKSINEELKKDAPSVAILKTQANALDAAAKAVGNAFPKGSGSEAGVKTSALPAIWAKPAEFKAAMTKFQAATKALKTAAAGGKLDAIKTAAGGIGPNCKGCHDSFKGK